MKWNKEEIDYLVEKYPTNTSIEKIVNHLDKSKKAIRHKAARLNLSRPRMPSNKPKNPNHRNEYDKRYYTKNSKTIYQKKKERLNNRKKELIEFLGGKCSKCGYSKCIAALEFHHVKGNKEGHPREIIKNFSKQKALKEVKKCIILCANCHRELHHNKDP